MRPEHALAQALAGGGAPTRCPGAALEGIDALKFAIMTHSKFKTCQSFNTSDMREWLSGRYKTKYSDLSAKIQEAAEGLATSKLLAPTEPPAKTKKQPGRKVTWYKKAAWTDMTGEVGQEADRLDHQRD